MSLFQILREGSGWTEGRIWLDPEDPQVTSESIYQRIREQTWCYTAPNGRNRGTAGIRSCEITLSMHFLLLRGYKPLFKSFMLMEDTWRMSDAFYAHVGLVV